jgi:hypothetical protein
MNRTPSTAVVSSLQRIEEGETLEKFADYLLRKVKPYFPFNEQIFFDPLKNISASAYSFEKYGCAILFSKYFYGVNSSKMTHVTVLALGYSQPICKMEQNTQHYEFAPNCQGFRRMPIGAIPFHKIKKFMEIFAHCHLLSSFRQIPYSPGYILAVCRDVMLFLNEDNLPAAYVVAPYRYEDTKLPKNSLFDLIKAVVNFLLESSPAPEVGLFDLNFRFSTQLLSPRSLMHRLDKSEQE